MDKKTEALKLALEALKTFHYAMIDAGVLDRQEVLNQGFTAATAIKEALAQPEQEPVAWLWELTGEVTTDPDRADGMWLPLYTTAPQRTWVGLTDEQRVLITKKYAHVAYFNVLDVINEVETVLGIK